MGRRVLSGLGVCLLAGTAAAQCGWLPGEGVPGVSSSVRAAATWDPDGAGPLPPRVVLGGSFGLAGETITSGVAAWDGAAWHAMPVPAGSTLLDLAVVDGGLYMGTTTGVLVWDGAAWQPVGGTIGPVNAVVGFGGALYAGGSFPSAQQATHRVARWDGASWVPVADGPDGSVECFLVDGASLLVGGQFSRVGPASATIAAQGVARFDGQSWAAVGPGQALGGYVLALARYGGRLYAGGNFQISQQSGRSIASFDGTAWSIVGGGMGAFTVDALLVHNGMLAVGGGFTSAGGVAGTGGFVRWDGSQWVPSGGARTTSAMAVLGNDIIAAGSLGFAGMLPVRNAARFDGAQWHAMGSGLAGTIKALAVLDGEPVISAIDAVSFATGRVLRRAGGQWQALGGQFGLAPDALAVHNGVLYAGGNFSTIDQAPVQRVVRWNGSAWVNVGVGGPSGPVQSLGSFGGGLVVGGIFATAGGVPARRIARFDGAAWSAFGDGLGASQITGDTGVKTIVDFGGRLTVGGRFGSGASWPNVSQWTGAEWVPLGSLGTSENYSVRSLAVYQGELYAAGLLSLGAPQSASVARWDGAAWQSISGTGAASVNALAADGSGLYAGGTFSTIGGTAAANFARWDGQAWSAVDGGLNGAVSVLSARAGGIDAGGAFLLAGGAPSAAFARLECSAVCYANCDGSTAVPVLNVNDFVCFQTKFAAGDPGANCDGSTVVPVLNVNDFICFQSAYAAGCP